MSDCSFPNAATPDGSAPYYCVRFSPVVTRDMVATAFAWRAELEHIVCKANDPGAARLKLDWWREELSGILQGTTRHPLSVALPPLLSDAYRQQLMLNMLEGIENDIQKIQPNDPHGFFVRCDLIGGSFGKLLSISVLTDSSYNTDDAQLLGGYDEAVTRVCYLTRYLRRDFCPLPRLTEDGTEITLATLKNTSDQAHLPRLITQLLERKSAQIRKILEIDRRAKRVSPVHRLAAQAMVLNAKMARYNYDVMNRQWELSPIRRLWAAWRLQ